MTFTGQYHTIWPPEDDVLHSVFPIPLSLDMPGCKFNVYRLLGAFYGCDLTRPLSVSRLACS